MKRALVFASLCLATIAQAQPAPRQPAPSGEKVDAQALMASGLRLYAAKDYLGALAVFRDAYARFPSAKLLLNIGTTQKALGRTADAANTYQRYLDAADAEGSKTADVTKALAELDAKLGVVDITASPGDAEIQIGNSDWLPAREAAHYRIDPGATTVRARRADFTPSEKAVEVAAGAHVQVSLELAKVATPVATSAATSTTGALTTEPDDGIAATAPAAETSRFGAYALAHADFKFTGAAAFVGLSYEAITRLQIEAGAILGPSSGAYGGARYAVLGGMLRPTIAAGIPVFVSSGARVGVRGAGGLEVAVHRHLSIVAEIGVEHFFNPEPNVASTLLIPAVGAAGRL